MNTVYNFYSEGVLNRFVLKLKSGDDNSFFDSTRARVYIGLFSLIVVYGLWGKRRPQVENDAKVLIDSTCHDTSVKLRLM